MTKQEQNLKIFDELQLLFLTLFFKAKYSPVFSPSPDTALACQSLSC